MKRARLERIPPPFPYLKYLPATNTSFVTITKPLCSKREKHFVQD